jgi:hypothetical protein
MFLGENMFRKITLFLSLCSLNANASLPPTSSRVSGDISNITTFITNYGSFTGTRTGSSLTIDGIGVASGTSLVLGGSLTTNSIADFQSTTKAFLPPRMTTSQKLAISPAASGMVVYDTSLNLLSTYNGSTWVNPSTTAGTPVVPGYSGNVDTFSISFGASATSACASANGIICPYSDGIGAEANVYHGSSTGIYVLQTSKTYNKLKCVGTSESSSGDGWIRGPINCTVCSSVQFLTVLYSTALTPNSWGTLYCIGTY